MQEEICTLDRCIRDDTDKYNIQERTYRVESEGVELLSVQGFSSSMKLETHLRTMDGLEAPVLIAQSPFCRPLCGHSLGRARNPRWGFGSGYT